jgi:iron complex outermembrane receptor protein
VGGRLSLCRRRINATLGAYLTNFHNRLLAVSTSVGILGTASTLQNVGGVRSVGMEALISAPGPRFFGTLSYSYNDSTYRNDVVTNTGTVVHTGKTTVDAAHLARAELAYDNKVIFGRIAANYMSKRYFTYTNDQRYGLSAGARCSMRPSAIAGRRLLQTRSSCR